MVERLYAPLLRWKRAERLAMGDISPEDAAGLLPIVEVVPQSMSEKNLADMTLQFQNSWPGRRMIVDGSPRELRDTDQARVLYSSLAARAAGLTVDLAPVLQPTDTPAIVAAASSLSQNSGGGMALRLQARDLPGVSRLQQHFGLRTQDSDLIVDFGIVAQDDPRYSEALEFLPLVGEWRTVIFLGGAFPKDLTGLEVGQHLLPRHDWLSWSCLPALENGQHPSYGDYATQHPVYSEPPPFSNFSASIRYAVSEDWLVMRGEGVRNAGGAGYAQWPANAQLLCERAEFCGGTFSAGDAYIEMMGTDPPSNGSAESWLRAGLSHHIAMASRQVANHF
jgi:hypothetical protein